MTPSDAIANLDGYLQDSGEKVTLRRPMVASPGYVDVECWAKITGYAPEGLVADITQQVSLMVLSPTPLLAGAWPGAAGGPVWPQNNDQVIRAGPKTVRVVAGTPIRMQNETVRLECRVLG